MTWTVPTPSPVDGPMTGDDRPILEGYLNYQRSTLLNICAGLTGEQLGLIRHLAKVERIWFRQRAAGQPVPPMYDPARGKDADYNDAVAAEAEADIARLQEEWREADKAAAGLDFDGTLDTGHGDTFSVRMMYVHLIGEYARHNGHADLLREALDGVTGR
jgi:Protein of unknown function (DUF664)